MSLPPAQNLRSDFFLADVAMGLADGAEETDIHDAANILDSFSGAS